LQSLCSKEAKHSFQDIISWFTELRTDLKLDISPSDMRELDSWDFSRHSISHTAGKYFEIIGIHAEIGNREVSCWDQPLMKQVNEGLVGFLVKEFNGIWHVLVQAKVEPGNLDVLSMSPTVQCITGSYKKMEYFVPYIDYFLKGSKIHYDTLQSEEGGRFYHEQNRYMLAEAGDDFVADSSPFYCWMTFRQIKQFILFNNYFNIEARSLVACVSPL